MEYVIDSVLVNYFLNFVNTFAFTLNMKYCMFQNMSKIIELFLLVSRELFFNNIFHIGLTSARLPIGKNKQQEGLASQHINM